MQFLIKNKVTTVAQPLVSFLLFYFHTYDTLMLIGIPSDGLKAMFDITASLVNGIY